ncbi:hypothetical protein ACGFJT_36625 [Actinomadura geliboluensis]|uniref:hypothetical protein n=1 Tax=Actinomadura geliboluensis TaxID=882440 RepID=UPI003720E51B
MPSVLVIHGTGGPRRSAESLRLEWRTSMQDGLVLAGAPAGLLDDPGAVGVVGLDGHDGHDGHDGLDGLDGLGGLGGLGAPAGPPTPWEEAVLRAWLRSAVFDDAAVGPPLTALGRSRYFAGLPPEELLDTVRTMTAYLLADEGGERAVRLVRAALTPDVRVVVGFSLGSVPAFDAVAGEPGRALVTVGSPLALRDRPDLPGGPRRRRRPIAAPWLNLVDAADALAGGDGLAGRYGEAVRDVFLDCDPRLRAPRPYAATAEFGQALSEAAGLAAVGTAAAGSNRPASGTSTRTNAAEAR